MTTFFRLLRVEDRERALQTAVDALNAGETTAEIHEVDPAAFRQVPGSPFAYWVSDRIRRLFRELPPFEGEGRTVRQGLATADDFRFVRCWWEAPPDRILDSRHGPDWHDDLPAFQAWCRQRTFEGKRWVPFAKGGEYSPFYADLHLVVNWERDGEEMKTWAAPLYGNSGWSRIIKSTDFYFRPGLTWPRRTDGLSFRPGPAGAIFADKGSMLFIDQFDELIIRNLAAVCNSSIFFFLVSTLTARVSLAQSYEVGIIKSIPLPVYLLSDQIKEVCLKIEKIALMRSRSAETKHVFFSPCLENASENFEELQAQIDSLACDLYGLTDADRAAIQDARAVTIDPAPDAIDADEAEPGTNNQEQTTDHQEQRTKNSLSHALGCLFGRWDIRLASGEHPQPPLPDPFDPLPVCPPGMLQSDDGLPLKESPPGYPLSLAWSGLLPDDPDHPDDLIRRLIDVLERLAPPDAIPTAKTLRDTFRRPGKGGFWNDHISRYSKSRRKAPIYWLLQSSKKNYAIWLYYHRLDKDLLFKALVNYVEPKIRLETTRLETLLSDKAAAGESSKEAKRLAKEAERQEDFLSELRDFEDKLRRAANLHLEPDLNDGVVLNIAPLHELVPWKEAKKYWDELLAGKYEWSAIGKQLREKGLVS